MIPLIMHYHRNGVAGLGEVRPDLFKSGYSQPIVIRPGQIRLPIESGHSGVYDRNECLLENTSAISH